MVNVRSTSILLAYIFDKSFFKHLELFLLAILIKPYLVVQHLYFRPNDLCLVLLQVPKCFVPVQIF